MHRGLLARILVGVACGTGTFLGVQSASAEQPSQRGAIQCEDTYCVFGVYCDLGAGRGCDVQPFGSYGFCKTYSCNGT